MSTLEAKAAMSPPANYRPTRLVRSTEFGLFILEGEGDRWRAGYRRQVDGTTHPLTGLCGEHVMSLSEATDSVERAVIRLGAMFASQLDAFASAPTVWWEVAA